MLHATGFFSFREREYPTIGCDSYDAMPDDLDDPDAYPLDEPEENEPELAETTTASANGHVASEGAPDANAEPSTVVVASSSESPVVATSETGEPNTEVSLPKPGGSALVPAGGEPETEGKPLDRTDGVETEAARVKKLEASA